MNNNYKINYQNGGGTKYKKNVSEPWFTLISLGIKTVEGRLNKGDFKNFNKGDVITWTNNDFNFRSVKTKIIRKTKYNSFEDYLQNENLKNTLPSIYNLEDGVNIYRKYYTKEDENKYGIIALQLEKLNDI